MPMALERTVRSVANLTRKDGEEFLEIVAAIPINTTVHACPLHRVNEGLDDLRISRSEGSAVIDINGGSLPAQIFTDSCFAGADCSQAPKSGKCLCGGFSFFLF